MSPGVLNLKQPISSFTPVSVLRTINTWLDAEAACCGFCVCASGSDERFQTYCHTDYVFPASRIQTYSASLNAE